MGAIEKLVYRGFRITKISSDSADCDQHVITLEKDGIELHLKGVGARFTPVVSMSIDELVSLLDKHSTE